MADINTRVGKSLLGGIAEGITRDLNARTQADIDQRRQEAQMKMKMAQDQLTAQRQEEHDRHMYDFQNQKMMELETFRTTLAEQSAQRMADKQTQTENDKKITQDTAIVNSTMRDSRSTAMGIAGQSEDPVSKAIVNDSPVSPQVFGFLHPLITIRDLSAQGRDDLAKKQISIRFGKASQGKEDKILKNINDMSETEIMEQAASLRKLPIERIGDGLNSATKRIFGGETAPEQNTQTQDGQVQQKTKKTYTQNDVKQKALINKKTGKVEPGYTIDGKTYWDTPQEALDNAPKE